MVDGRQMIIAERLAVLFPSFSSELRMKLATLGELARFQEGQTMMRTGQYFRSTMLILSGTAKLYKEGVDGGEHFLYYLEPGSACALSMICATQRKASIIKSMAEDDLEALALPIEHMDDLMRDHVDWYHFVLETYRLRFEETLEVIDQVAFRSLDQRLIFYLNNQFRTHESDELRITHQDIATDLNSSREVISRLLKRMEREGMLELHRHALVRKEMPSNQDIF
jgi:CRP/FNR family transcriptional regulator